jgi:hypothetical protein
MDHHTTPSRDTLPGGARPYATRSGSPPASCTLPPSILSAGVGASIVASAGAQRGVRPALHAAHDVAASLGWAVATSTPAGHPVAVGDGRTELTVYDPFGFNQSRPGRLVRRQTHEALVERRW